MTYKYEVRDLFTVDKEYIYAHCISSDFVMGAGIALQFTKRGVKDKLMSEYEQKWEGCGYCIPIQMKQHLVVNLVTKDKVYHKPTYKSLTESLQELKRYMLDNHKTKLAMPLIGCGIDGLDWTVVEYIIKGIFYDTNFEILVCEWS